jgi:hypothetical protein
VHDLSFETPPLFLSRHPMAPQRYGRAVARMAGRSDIGRIRVASCRRPSVRSPRPRLRAVSTDTARIFNPQTAPYVAQYY